MSKQAVMQRTLDPVTFEVLRRSFEYTCERMSQVLQKSSFSPIIYDMVDFSNAIFNADVELIGQTANCPVHLAAMHFSARASLKKYPVEDMQDGDVIILNDPYEGGTHNPDVTLTAPVFNNGELLGFAVSRAHWTDVGGNFDTHNAGEGMRLPPLKLVEAGETNTDLVSIIRNSTRTPQYIEGDIQAQLAALWSARNEMQRIAQKYGNETLLQGMKEVLDYTQEMTKAAIRRIPNGVYHGQDYIDSDGISEEPVWVKLKLTVDDDIIHVDLSESDDQVLGPINSPYANTASAIYYSLKFFVSPESPANAGMYRQIELNIREGSWLNPVWPAAVLGCTTATSSKITGAVWNALAEAIPEQIVASTYADANWFVASISDPVTKQVEVFTDLPAGGWGGTPAGDGMHVTMDPLGNCQNLPAETAEMLYPIRYNSFEMRTDSAGAGEHRGGAGVRVEIEFLGRGEIITMESSRTREGSPGVRGGGHGGRQRQERLRPDGTLETIGGLDEEGTWLPQMLGGVEFAPNDAFVFSSGGGGGWGDPKKRKPELVAADVRNEVVSFDAAREIYGVEVRNDFTVDSSATDHLRS